MNTAVLTATSTAFVPTLLDLLLKAGVLLALATLAALACRRASAALRHLIWTLAVAGVLLLPALTALLPAWQVVRLPEWRLPTMQTSALPAPYPSIPAPVTTFGEPPTHPDQSPSPAATVPAPPITSPESPEVGRTLLSAPTSPAAPPPTLTQGRRSLGEGGDTQYPTPVILALAWALGTALLLARHLAGYVVTRRLLRRARPADEDWAALLAQVAPTVRVRLLQSDSLTVPLVVGLLRPTILLPALADAWPSERRRVVLLHELAHLRRRDLLAQALTVLACALYWPNPLIWLAAHRLRVEREVACDDAVLLADVRPSDYAVHLLAVAAALPARPLALTVGIAMAQSSKLGARITALLDPRRRRGGVTWQGVVLLLLVAAFAVLFLAQLRRQTPKGPLGGTTAAFTPIPVPGNAQILLANDEVHYAYLKQLTGTPTKGKQAVIHDGVQGPIFSTASFERVSYPWKRHDLTEVQAAPAGLFLSPDGRRLAYAVDIGMGKMYAMVVDGVRQANYDDMTKPAFSLDSRHVAYAAKRGERWCVVYDGVEGPTYDRITYKAMEEQYPLNILSALPPYDINPVCFSPDSSRYAYVVKDNDKYRVIVDGMAGPEYDVSLLERSRFAFSPDSRHFVYLAVRDSHTRLVYDNQEGEAFDLSSPSPVFSPDSQHLAYTARRGRNSFLVRDGQESAAYQSIGTPVFSLDSRHLACDAKRDGKAYLITDGQESKGYQSVTSLLFSPDSQHLTAVVQRKNEAAILLLDGKEQPAYRWPEWITFSPDSRRIAALSSWGKLHNFQLIVDGQSICNVGQIWSFGFSPDSKHTACVTGVQHVSPVVTRERISLYIDGGKQPYETTAALPVWSPTGDRMAYVAKIGAQIAVVLDGKALPGTDGTIDRITFSPDGKHVLYNIYRSTGYRSGSVTVAVDGVEYDTYKQLLFDKGQKTDDPYTSECFFFDAPDRAHYFAIKDGAIQRVEVNLSEKPAIPAVTSNTIPPTRPGDSPNVPSTNPPTSAPAAAASPTSTNGPAPPTSSTDEQVRTVLIQARTLISKQRFDEAISALLPLETVAGDRLIKLPPLDPSRVIAQSDPRADGPQTSVVELLALAYWGKRDAAHTLPYMETVASRTSPNDDSLVPGVVFAAREMLATQGKDLPEAYTLNGSFIKHIVVDGQVYLDAKRIAEVCHLSLGINKNGGEVVSVTLTGKTPDAQAVSVSAIMPNSLLLASSSDLLQQFPAAKTIRDARLHITDLRLP
jgi:beta-lactamase regulating signal transducer with metallopeptidase domain